MNHPLRAFACASLLILTSPAHGDESSENRSTKAWSFEGSSAYRPYDVREYALGVTRFDDLTPGRGGTSIAFGRLWTNRAYYGMRNYWKLDGHSLSVGYRKFLGNSFFAEAGLLAESIRAWAAYARVDEDFEPRDFGRAQRLALTFQLGNQWQWEHFNWGFSWLGMIVPLAYDTSKALEDASFRNYLRTSSNYGVRLFFGWAV